MVEPRFRLTWSVTGAERYAPPYIGHRHAATHTARGVKAPSPVAHFLIPFGLRVLAPRTWPTTTSPAAVLPVLPLGAHPGREILAREVRTDVFYSLPRNVPIGDIFPVDDSATSTPSGGEEITPSEPGGHRKTVTDTSFSTPTKLTSQTFKSSPLLYLGRRCNRHRDHVVVWRGEVVLPRFLTLT
ncbi:hypothetical protein BaRGS_00024192 [Batillaria attramentaria]|uniref:Uncharacterized protein n=1 Tax=Batillaria attramentaria TaxID=370345 RepID=A0ABD0KBV1_9CAEN